MIGLTMKHLRYFDALARLRHFGRAAEDCAVSQPALSVQIRELEAQLGAPLVERGSRQIRLTPLGEEVARRADVILKQAQDLGALARIAGGSLSGPLRLGVIPTVAPYLLPAILATITSDMPGIELLPREAVTQKLVADLSEARLDAAIVALPLSEPGLTEMPLFEEEFVLARPPQEAGQPVPELGSLRAMRLLLLEEGHCFRDQALSFCHSGTGAAPEAQLREVMEGSSLATLAQMVGAGLGVTLLPEMALSIESRSSELALARLPVTPSGKRPGRQIGMVWRRSNPLGPALGEIAHKIAPLGTAASAAGRRLACRLAQGAV